MDDNKFIAIMDKLSEVGERTARIEAKQDVMDKRLSFIESEDATQNKLLAEHIEGTVQNRLQIKNEKERREALASAHEKLKGRVEKLEIPVKALSWVKSRIMWLAVAGGGIVAILSYFKHG